MNKAPISRGFRRLSVVAGLLGLSFFALLIWLASGDKGVFGGDSIDACDVRDAVKAASGIPEGFHEVPSRPHTANSLSPYSEDVETAPSDFIPDSQTAPALSSSSPRSSPKSHKLTPLEEACALGQPAPPEFSKVVEALKAKRAAARQVFVRRCIFGGALFAAVPAMFVLMIGWVVAGFRSGAPS